MSDAKLAVIRKLLAQAEDPGVTEAEAEAFTAKAEKLMAEYGIDEALIAAERNIHGVGDLVLDFTAPYARDKSSLVGGVAHAMRCRAVVRGAGQSRTVHVFGMDADLACVDMLVTSLLVQATHALGRTAIPAGEHVAAFRRSWWAGFSAAVYARLLEIQKQATEAADRRRAGDGPSTEIVLASRVHEVEAAMHEAYPRLRQQHRRRLSGRGMGAGYESGQQADLSMGNALTHQPAAR